MKNMKKSRIYLIMFIAFAIVILGVGSYAYLLNSAGVGDVLNANTVTAKESTFTSYHDGELTFNISASQMAQMEVSTDPIATDNATMTVELSGSSDYESTICTYDVVWVWDSDTNNRYVQSDVSLPYVSSSGIKYPYEFSVQLNSGTEIDLSELDWSDDGTTAVLLSQQRISSDSNIDKTIQNYEVTIRMYNIGAAQKNLFDKDFKAHIEMQNYDCVTETITSGNVHYYVKQDDGSYVAVADLGIPTGLNFDVPEPTINETKSYCKRNGGYEYDEQTNSYKTTVADDECYIYIDSQDDAYLASAITNSAGVTVGTGQVVEENGYRFEGDNPNNYICFGSEDTSCPADNLYRIIGAFNVESDTNNDGVVDETGYLAKIQKNTMYGDSTMVYHSVWDGVTTNSHYPNSQIYSTLNTTWHNSLSSTYQNQIASVNWSLGALQQNYMSLPVGDFYTQERGTSINAGITEYEKVFKVGMMYPSDYGYAVLSGNCARTTALYSYNGTANCYGLNWMYDTNNDQWTMTNHILSGYSYAFYLTTSGNVSNINVGYSRSVRPAFYLNSNIKVTDGSGTSTDPYRISL